MDAHKKYFASKMKKWCTPSGKHGRGTGGAAPASNAAGRGDAQGTPLPARPAASGHVDPTWVSSTRADASRFGPESAGIGRYRPESAETAETADSGRNSKKKKKPRTHRILNSNPTSAQMHSKRQKHSSHYISLTLNLVYVCIMWKNMLSNILKI